jgi:hypothetical protein
MLFLNPGQEKNTWKFWRQDFELKIKSESMETLGFVLSFHLRALRHALYPWRFASGQDQLFMDAPNVPP